VIYKYTIQGTAATGQIWRTTGYVSGNPGDFRDVCEQAQGMSFHQLTQGKAVYGHPGKGGCRGPYTITQFTVEVVPAGQVNALREAGELPP
jgi:hypothetical protein